MLVVQGRNVQGGFAFNALLLQKSRRVVQQRSKNVAVARGLIGEGGSVGREKRERGGLYE